MNKKQQPGKKSHSGHQQEHGNMGNRGVTRPMMHHHQHQEKEDDHGNNASHHMMTEDQRIEMQQMHHQQTLWIYWLVVLLGCWTLLSPFTFSYHLGLVEPSGGRDVWLSLSQRINVSKWSDIISGIVLIIFGWRSLTPDRPVSRWICCFVGIWMNMAPLIFWAPSAVIYLNDTLVGVLVIALTILIPGMPNMIRFMKMGSEVPKGWTYNPSSWPQRWIMIVMGFAGWVVSRYLGAFQLGYLDHVWEPFFTSSEKVLNSAMSHSLPVSDAALGSLAYTFEFLMGWMGSPSRWRTMPWMVTFFGILVIPLGLVHIFLVISQPLVVGAWCTFCLLAAAIMLPMIPLEADEVVAMGQHMVQAKKNGESFWKVFWKGGKPVEHNQDERSPALVQFPSSPGKIFKASVWGMSVPWSLLLSTAIGIAIMFAPALYGVSINTSMADINHLFGALIVVIAVISMGEIVRIARYANVLAGLAVAILPWLTGNESILLQITDTVAGALVVILSIPRGVVKEKYGSWDRFVR